MQTLQKNIIQRKQTAKDGKAFFQPKLTIDQPNDGYEQEANAMADHVMQAPNKPLNNNSFFKPSVSSLQRKCAHCEEEEKKMQRKEDGTIHKPASKNAAQKQQRLIPGVCEFYEGAQLMLVQSKANDLTNLVLAKLDSFISDGKDKAVAASLNANFKSTDQTVAIKVRAILKMIAADLAKEGRYECRDDENENQLAYSYGQFPIVIEDLFWKQDFTGQALTLIHEYTHFHSFSSAGTASAGISDISYNFERSAPYLTTNESLLNADSYLSFVGELTISGQPYFTVLNDNMVNCDNSEPDKKLLKVALVEIEKRNIEFLSRVTTSSQDNYQLWSGVRLKAFKEDTEALRMQLKAILKVVEIKLNNPLSIACTNDPRFVAYASQTGILINPYRAKDESADVNPYFNSVYEALVGMATAEERFKKYIPNVAKKLYEVFANQAPPGNENITPV